MSDIHRLLPRAVRRHRRRRVVVVLADRPREVARLDVARSPWAQARVVPLVGVPPAQTHAHLARLPRLDLVVDVRRSSGPAQLETYRQCFFHLDPQGVWVALRRPGVGRPGLRPPGIRRRPEPLAGLARRLRSAAGPSEEWREHARSATGVRVTPRAVLIRARRRSLLRLREDEVSALLPLREPALQVTTVAHLDGGSVSVAGRVTDHGAHPEPHLPDVLTYPPHTVRRYEGRIRLPRASLTLHRRTVLPDSFRWHLAPEPGSPGLRPVDEHFSRLTERTRPRHLDGSYFLFLYANPGHFGHLMTEALAKLWGWWPAKAADPDLKLLCREHPTRGDAVSSRLEQIVLPACGIAPEDVVWVDGPVTVDRLVGCTPMWHNAPPFYFHPALRETWDRLRVGLIGDAVPDGPSHLFVTRRVGGRPCSNVEDVERLFAGYGFTVVSPENLSLADQARLFAGARVVAGLGGSGMFNLMFAPSVETVVVLNQWAYQARNEHLFAAAHGARIHCFWSRPDEDHPPGGFSYAAHQGPWRFDIETHGPGLRDLLRSIGSPSPDSMVR